MSATNPLIGSRDNWTGTVPNGKKVKVGLEAGIAEWLLSPPFVWGLVLYTTCSLALEWSTTLSICWVLENSSVRLKGAKDTE